MAMLSSVPARLIVRRTRSLSPSNRVFQTNVNAATCQGICNTQVDTHRNTVVSTSRDSKRGILDDKKANGNSFVQYQKFTHRWLSNLDNRRRSWAALAVRGRNKNQYWEESHETCRAVLAPVGLLTAAAVAFCLRKDSDNKGDALLEAAKTSNSEDVERLLKDGADPNHRHRLGWTALMVAAMNQQHGLISCCSLGQSATQEIY